MPQVDSSFFFFQNQTSNANSTVYQVVPNNNPVIIKATGTWGGANVILQTMALGTGQAPLWIQLNDINGNPFAFTSNAQLSVVDIIPNENVRAVLSGATGTTNITVSCEFI
jgi:hypothetical protein